MFSNSHIRTVPLDGEWVYQDLFINKTDTKFEIPQNIIIHNNTDYFMKFKIMEIDEGEGDTFSGTYLRGGLDQAITDRDSLYKIGIAFVTTQSAVGEVLISCTGFRKVVK